ncbi:MAG: hypothetical protein Q4C70_09225 [Planctomycetia bacterium]|nr:hypothetical protein [Planctomycetia bacterium]
MMNFSSSTAERLPQLISTSEIQELARMNSMEELSLQTIYVGVQV